ncbi:MAG: RNA polymerase factor sigma-54, partial [Planctomycetota bacterium]
MRIDAGQHLRIDQRMKLAPRMIQSMEILQMPQAALEERIEQELASNPTLEVAEPGLDPADYSQTQQQAERDAREGEREIVTSDNAAEDFERLSNLSEQYGEAFDADVGEPGAAFARRQVSAAAGGRDGKLDAMANTAARGASLYEQLLQQWHLTELDTRHPNLPNASELGEYLLGFIDADGYLRTSDQALLDDAPPGTTADHLAAVIDTLQQTLEPPGLAARDFRQCLLLQLDNKLATDPDLSDAELTRLEHARLLVDQYLKDIEANRYPKIVKSTGLDLDTLKHAVAALRQFHPHPGRLLAADEVRTITPDAVITYDDEDDTYTAALTNSRVPALTISQDYADLAKNRAEPKATRDFVNNHLRSAAWLLDAIQQRQNTLLRVIGVVVAAQRDFFDQGPQALKPLPMTQVADQLGIHVATVSRAVSEKYLQTPRGIFPLRMFFSGGTETESGESMSWAAVQAKLQEIIDGEDKSKPWSDDALVEQLKDHGI